MVDLFFLIELFAPFISLFFQRKGKKEESWTVQEAEKNKLNIIISRYI